MRQLGQVCGGRYGGNCSGHGTDSIEMAKERARKAGLKPGRVKGTDHAIQFTKGRNNRIEVISWEEFTDVLAKRRLAVYESSGFMKIMKRK